jgi:polyphosphate kinase 2 (PPK2 family)
MDLLIKKDQANTLTQLEHELADRKMATVILMEGPGGMAMSHIVNQIVAIFEPRNIKYHSISSTKMPWVKYCLLNVAPKGTISIFDRGWYTGIIADGDEWLTQNINLANSFERYLYNNGVNVIKIYLDYDEDKMKKFKKSYPVDLKGESEIFNDDLYEREMSLSPAKIKNLLQATNTKYSGWEIIKMEDYEDTIRKIATVIEAKFIDLLKMPRVPEKFDILEVYPNPREKVDFSKEIDKDTYEKKLDKLQKKLAELQIELAKSEYALVLVFEGWDAAGKGGCIKRVTQALNPRGYKTFPTPAPTPEEKSHTHLWRFAKNMPDPGKIAIFDRSWYGRMMVEPIEGFCSEVDYSRAAGEINLFESALANSHVIFIKFWVDVTKEEQLVRFNDRAADPMKSWKLTDEDWRNREKWDTYETYINSMIKQTNTPHAPWVDIECVDKRYGRIKVLETIVDVLKEKLD